MKTIGAIDGMSWHPTLPCNCARGLGVLAQGLLGELHSATAVLCSDDLAEVVHIQAGTAWGEAWALMAQATRSHHATGKELR